MPNRGTYGFGTYGSGTYGDSFELEPTPPTGEVIGSFAKAVYDEMVPMQYAEAEQGSSLWHFISAVGEMLQDIDALAHDTVAPWSSVLDLDRIPDEGLLWLAQFAGVRVNPEFTPDQQKQQIRSHENWQRGTAGALRNSIRYLLSGTRTVEIVERYPDPYSFEVNTYSTETPADQTYQGYYTDYANYGAFYAAWDSYRSAWLSSKSNLIQALISDNKPAGLNFIYSVLPGSPGSLNSYATIFIKYDTAEELFIADQTYADVYFET